MALSSQMTARGGGSSYSGGRRRRGRSRPKRVLILVAVAVLAWVGWSFIFSGSPEEDPPTEPPEGIAGAADDEAQDAGETGTPGGGDTFAAGTSGGSSSRATAPAPFTPTPPRDLSRPTVSDDAPSPDDTTSSTTTPTTTSTERDPEPEPAASTPGEVEQSDARRSTTRQSATTQSRAEAKELMEEGQALYEDDEPVEARAVLNTALSSGGLNERDAQDVRDLMAQINDTLIFSPRVDPDDPYVEAYEVQSGDLLSRIADRYDIPWQLAARVNGNLDPRRIRVGQRLKMIQGPFHLVVHKRKYRLDVYLGDMYIRSFDVGLGEHDMTPVGEFIVRSPKLEKPEWTNPRTGQKYLPNDPENPLGGYWIGIKGTTPDTEVHTGYGIHGTIEPDSIGTDASMGCIRLLPKDVGQLYAMLTEDQSRVLVVE